MAPWAENTYTLWAARARRRCYHPRTRHWPPRLRHGPDRRRRPAAAAPHVAAAVPAAPERAPVRRGRADAVVVLVRLSLRRRRGCDDPRRSRPPPGRAARRQRRQPRMAHALDKAWRRLKLKRGLCPPGHAHKKATEWNQVLVFSRMAVVEKWR